MQTWILRSDMNPLEAIHTGHDASICGDCPLRGILQDTERGVVNRREHATSTCIKHRWRSTVRIGVDDMNRTTAPSICSYSRGACCGWDAMVTQ